MEEKYVIGVDFGSDSVRATVVSTVSGSILWIIWKRLKAV